MINELWIGTSGNRMTSDKGTLLARLLLSTPWSMKEKLQKNDNKSNKRVHIIKWNEENDLNEKRGDKKTTKEIPNHKAMQTERGTEMEPVHFNRKSSLSKMCKSLVLFSLIFCVF